MYQWSKNRTTQNCMKYDQTTFHDSFANFVFITKSKTVFVIYPLYTFAYPLFILHVHRVYIYR